MVTTAEPSACWQLVRQEHTGLPSISTVQAPQSPASQPTFVPGKASFSRTTLLSRSAGAPATDTCVPFRENWTTGELSPIVSCRIIEELP